MDDLKPKKAKVNGKKKGSRVELELAKLLTAHFGEPFSRSIGSGNRWGQKVQLTEQAKQVFTGDLVVPENFKFTIESKGGYDAIDLNSVFVSGNSELQEFMNQAMDDSKRCGRKPMLCWKRTRKPWLVFLLTKDLAGQDFEYSIKYGQWTGVALEHLLKLDRSFFMK